MRRVRHINRLPTSVVQLLEFVDERLGHDDLDVDEPIVSCRQQDIDDTVHQRLIEESTVRRTCAEVNGLPDLGGNVHGRLIRVNGANGSKGPSAAWVLFVLLCRRLLPTIPTHTTSCRKVPCISATLIFRFSTRPQAGALRRPTETIVGAGSKSIRITTRRTVGRVTSAKPAAAKMLRLPT